MPYVVNSTSGDESSVRIEVSFTSPDNPAIITTPFSLKPLPMKCDVCGKEYEPDKDTWLSISNPYSGSGGKVYRLCPKCAKEIEGMINVLIQVLKGGEKE